MIKGYDLMIKVFKANLNNIDFICDLSESLNYKNVSDVENGVLIRVLDKNTVENNIDNFLIASVDDEFAGFLWYSWDYPYDMINNTILYEDISDCVYSEQIGVSREYKRCGIGRAFYEYLSALTGKNVLVYVNKEPEGNLASLNFHKSVGFKVVGIFEADEFVGIKGFKSYLLKK
ncbi:GNAT family N-acetyltransferase [Oceanotoga teriensis]|uniref:GNAT family N-acetyltransferase n=1 Tax=Oceanotoga teriensis TaxID=515440 RepID=UPI0027138F5D|nr:GNAT family N-acetyltransferase [Oceanotoga teriensis]MDO7975785.1 GNAT family N-acetyltransferase [Oceanotoga teriensis]